MMQTQPQSTPRAHLWKILLSKRTVREGVSFDSLLDWGWTHIYKKTVNLGPPGLRTRANYERIDAQNLAQPGPQPLHVA